MILNVDFAFKLSNYTSWKLFICLMNPKKKFYNTAYSAQPLYIAGHSLERKHVTLEVTWNKILSKCV